MWSEGFASEERASRPDGISLAVAALGGVVLAGAAIAVEVVLSVDVAAWEMSARGGSWLLGLISLGLGFAGPYAAIRISRNPRRADEQKLRRVGRIAAVALTVAALALAWLLLIHSQRPLTTVK